MPYPFEFTVEVHKSLAADPTRDLLETIDDYTTLRFTKGALWGNLDLTVDFNADASRVFDWIDDGCGRDVSLYSPGGSRIFSGYVDAVNASIGSLSVTRGPLIGETANKIACQYSTVDTTFSPPILGVRETTAWYQDTDSQAKYGIIESLLSTGGATDASAITIAQTALDSMREPPKTESDNVFSSSSNAGVSISVRGYWNWLNAYFYTQTAATGTQNASTEIANIIAADPNSILSTSTFRISTNTFQVRRYHGEPKSAYELIRGIVSIGDASFNRWVFGIDEDLVPYYNVIPTSPIYERHLADPKQYVAVFGDGNEVLPWLVQPGERVFYIDPRYGFDQDPDETVDSRFLFIEKMSFQAPRSLILTGGRAESLSQLMARQMMGGID